MEEPATLDDLIVRVIRIHPDGNPRAHLAEAISMSERLGEVADQLVGHFVDAARRSGMTWAEIGSAMGVTRQAVQKRFVPKHASTTTIDATIVERFTPRARAIITATQDEARSAGHDYLGTEHIVLGLLSQPKGLAAAFIATKATSQQVRTAMAEVLGPRTDTVPEEIPYTPRGRKSLELSLQEAQRLGHDHVGTEHILLGVLAERHGVGAQVLVGLGIDRRGVEEWLAANDV